MKREAMVLREIRINKRNVMKKAFIGAQREDRTCILTRWNGHVKDIPEKPGQF